MKPPPPLFLPRRAVLFLSLTLAFVFAGCTSPGGPSSAATEKSTFRPASASLSASKVATITIYRPDVDGPDRSLTVAVNGHDLVTPRPGTVFTTRLPPGTYHFELDGERAGDLKASAGGKYAFQIAIVPGGYSGTGRLGIVSPQQAKDETAHLTPVEKDDIDAETFR